MRLLVDLMGAQTQGSRIRGIGRYTRELALALARTRDRRLDLRFAVSENFADAAAELRALLAPHVGDAAIKSYATPPSPQFATLQADPARRIGEAIVRRHVADVRPDALLASSLFEVAANDFSYFDLARQPVPLASAILYDLIPLRMPRDYLRDAIYRRAYEEQIAVLRSADLLFSISECTRRDAIELLGLAPERIVNISGAADVTFAPRVFAPDEIAARLRRLGLREPFIFCAAGGDPRKNARGAIDAFLMLSADDRRGAQFVLLAPLPPDERVRIAQSVARAGFAADDIIVLDRIGDDDLAFLYQHAMLFLFPSLYEGFGLPLLEAMQCGGAVIAGNNSSLVEIAGRADVLCDATSPAAIAKALAQGLRDEDWRADIRRWGIARAKDFSWDATARTLQAALFDRAPAAAASRHPPSAALALAETLETEVADILREAKRPSLTPQTVAPLIALSTPKLYDGAARRLLVDVTTIVRSDRRTGIQRVVRNIVRALYHSCENADVVPVAVRLHEGRLHTCQNFVADLVGCRPLLPDAPLVPARGDCLLMLDNSWSEFARFMSVFDTVHAASGTIVTCIYDLIPALYPAASVSPVPEVYGAWLRAALKASDGMIAISQAVMHDLVDYVRDHALPHRDDFRVGWFHCGSDLDADADAAKTPVRPALVNLFASEAPIFLVVGTIEPRKGHWTALDAFDELWAQGSPARLLFVGSKGWHVEALIGRMRAHPAWGTSLHWIADANDAELAAAYAHCTALLNPSYTEGFGLPLAEAARVGTPVICSDIPVFREVGGDGALYFRVNDAPSLAQTLRAFLAGESCADPARILQTTWADAAHRIVDVLMRDAWCGDLDGSSSRSGKTNASF